MQSMTQTIKNVLTTGAIYSIPPYQRHYEWGPELWHNLIHDVLIAGTNKDTEPSHWLGILLLSQDESTRFPDDDSRTAYSVIDGQQRLVTLLIWLSALVHHAEDTKEQITFRLENLCKLVPQKADQAALDVVMKKLWLDKKYQPLHESRVLQAYHYFRFALWLGEDALLDEQPIKVPKFKLDTPMIEYWTKYVSSNRGRDLVRGAPVKVKELIEATRSRLSIHTLIHEPRIDEPQAIIFDTLNGHRFPLEPLDHVRNSLFVRLPAVASEKIYDDFWEKAEQGLLATSIAMQKPGINFLYDYLISKGEKKRQGTINKNRGALHFNRMTRHLKDDKLAEFIKNDLTVAMSIWPVAIDKKRSVNIQGVEVGYPAAALELVSSIRELSSGPFNPLVLHYLVAYFNGLLDSQQLISNLFLIENYLVRQLLTLNPLSPLRSKVMDIAGNLDGRFDEISLKEALSKTWVTDEEILTGVEKRSFYDELGPRALGAVFRGIEIQLSGSGANKFRVSKNEYTIEHIYPRKAGRWEDNLTNWKSSPKRVAPFIDTLGNLTVVTQEHNSKVGNSQLRQKQEHPTVIGASAPLRLHEDWLSAKKWTEVEIQERTLRLIGYALKRWPSLELS
ncbi:MAG: DUF262 domain-containing protein [Actinobacteria bacterium]|jgi:hypothetical protein|nr:DUF262 domain-containing protein [Actinomycetota bacterium]NCW92951.1 DUF262 domain-containing protein [Actinomycetota bacterium]